MSKKKEPQREYQLTEDMAKAAGITQEQANSVGEGTFVAAYHHYIGDPIFGENGNLVLTGADTKKTDTKKNEYDKILGIVEDFQELTNLPAWDSIRKHVQNLQSQALTGLLEGEKKDFDPNQSTYKAAEAMVQPIRQAVENLNGLSRPGELPLWGEPTAKASFDKKTWKVEITKGESLSEEVEKLAKESGKTDEGATAAA